MDFDEIPMTWYDPAIFIEVKPNYSQKGIYAWPEKVLIAGHKLAAGTLEPGQIRQITRGDEATAYFGRGSIGAEQVAAFRKVNKTTPLYVTTLADADDAVKATGTITFTGAPSQSTVLRFKIAGVRIRVSALATDNVAALATKLAAAITAEPDIVVTAAAAAGVVTVTAKNGGEVGNDIDLRVDVTAQPVPEGLTIAVADMAGGAGNPDLQDVLDLIENAWFTKLQHPWSDVTNVQLFAEWLNARYVATAKLDCHGFTGKRATYAQAVTLGDLTNCAFLSLSCLSRSPTSSWVHAAADCALAAFHLSNDPARQLKSLVVNGVEAPDIEDQFSWEERNLLLQHGVSTYLHLDDGSTVINRMVTTYKKTSLGVLDDAWMDIMVPATMSRIRYDWSAYFNTLYPRAKLVDDGKQFQTRRAEGDKAAGSAVVSPGRIKGTWAARCQRYAGLVWIENAEATIEASTFERDPNDRNRTNARQIVQIVGNQMVFASSLEFLV
ncbi:phage tail sheath subtilisin-like domain-containing protein [Martelella endophytica]|uniref:Mu tail sheath family protein n=1 Tax=Martelella endophytica TaxID=1486262 RepID=A0A0D5LRU1_MAREN|nr:phage tail sheath subtilisin-like domain-containing protein [Martelella endophytica]AJY46482.1 Mu tail sheath family protein [Martelella endophytica]